MYMYMMIQIDISDNLGIGNDKMQNISLWIVDSPAAHWENTFSRDMLSSLVAAEIRGAAGGMALSWLLLATQIRRTGLTQDN